MEIHRSKVDFPRFGQVILAVFPSYDVITILYYLGKISSFNLAAAVNLQYVLLESWNLSPECNEVVSIYFEWNIKWIAQLTISVNKYLIHKNLRNQFGPS